MIKLKIKTIKENNNLVGFEVDYDNKHTSTLEHLVGIDYLVNKIMTQDENMTFDKLLKLIKENYEKRREEK